jgi:hypothetical protein
MAVTVELGLSKSFTLDDPVAGVIGSTEFVIGGIQFEDITSLVKSVSLKRGKNRDLDRFSAGVLSVVLNNQDRAFDPLYSASPFAGDIVPRRDVRVTAGTAVQYVGKILDWNLDYAPRGNQTASFEAADGFTFLAQQVLTPGTATEQLTGDRVNAVLNQTTVDWPAEDRDLDSGNSTLGADIFSGNALTYLQKVEQSEGGLFFVNKSGQIAFRDRLTPIVSGGITIFADNGSGIKFAPAAVEYGTEQLFNEVTVTSPFGTATAIDALSQTRYGILDRQINTLLSSQEQVEGLSDFLLGRYKEPELRFAAIQVDIDQISGEDKTTVFGLEIGDVVQVKITPGNPPVGSQIERYGLIISISHAVEPDSHTVIFGLGSLQTSLFVIGDAEFGKIGEGASGVLGF